MGELSKALECRETVKNRAEGMCERCCRSTSLTLHHRKKRSQGGAWTPTNILALCGHGTSGCHGWVEHNPNAAELEGLHVRPWQNPDELRVLYRGAWAMLTADGKVEYAREEVASDDGELLPAAE
ncbi:hypothetical protein MINTMi27_14840 [Mycobacterium intracellulare]|uniref:HNH endonuclease n=1 Tax=Mycobacterium intracellulare TaxID=1767 RepID=UPI00192764EC|nr:HNH endonuclease signature motif containing protein [Mycobacterium intracellulare]BCP41391.1 hypothetical protein MINTMi27_14840 [Mycobacterium intracellulare]